MRLPAFTIKQMMVIVLCSGLALHLTVAAWQAHRYGVPHLHSFILKMGNGPAWVVGIRNRPFWPAFWQRSLGYSSKEQRACFEDADALMEMCELAHPEIRMPMGPYTYAANRTKEQITFFSQLQKEQQLENPGNYPNPVVLTEIPSLLQEPLIKCLVSPASVRVTTFCFLGLDSLVTKVRKSARLAAFRSNLEAMGL
ncbi:hypothetical protein [Singulisphaera acidiphila]|uniref:Uncharacterized protein n=1 Tax=Singulisphaera acidiphila (strain ATCC BAA-1392 / DSM 18658 / VKM B-2454 / MOB10) TaxID=886293 RepID=L0DAI5_SINAD|nr:hypothetical protein [Singulisphaera acidiphila]AGA26267.1 hypothetical protein Sinac_1905 [Singulisphaera acidiphila DSM 18658]